MCMCTFYCTALNCGIFCQVTVIDVNKARLSKAKALCFKAMPFSLGLQLRPKPKILALRPRPDVTGWSSNFGHFNVRVTSVTGDGIDPTCSISSPFSAWLLQHERFSPHSSTSKRVQNTAASVMLGRVKLLSAAVLFNRMQESWRWAGKILSQFKFTVQTRNMELKSRILISDSSLDAVDGRPTFWNLNNLQSEFRIINSVSVSPTSETYLFIFACNLTLSIDLDLLTNSSTLMCAKNNIESGGR